MKRNFIIITFLFFCLKSFCIAQDNKTCVVITYIGISDKPIYPIVFCRPNVDTLFVKSVAKLYDKFPAHWSEILIFDTLSYEYMADKICSSIELSKVNKDNNYRATFSIIRYEKGKETQRSYLINSQGQGLNFFNGIKNSMIEMEKPDRYFYYIDDIIKRLYW